MEQWVKDLKYGDILLHKSKWIKRNHILSRYEKVLSVTPTHAYLQNCRSGRRHNIHLKNFSNYFSLSKMPQIAE